MATVTVTVAPPAGNLDYHVGPGQTYASIGAVPWYSLQPGSTVYIHYRATPYKEKFLISTRGTAANWIRVIGVPGPNGERPILDGNGAVTSTNSRYHWTDPSYFQVYGLVHVGPSTADVVPAYVEIAGLEIMNADQAYTFTAENGTVRNYDAFSAGIYIRGTKHVIVRDNVIHGCGLGLYTWAGGDQDLWWNSLSADVTLRGNYFYNNGVSGQYLQHQVYTESNGVVVEYNRFGIQRNGAAGSQFKDRSAGTVFRYNLVEESTGYFIDLVDPENGWSDIGSSNPKYGQDFVYGNTFINRDGSPNLVHWAEDQNAGRGRHMQPNGRLYFYDNTIFTLANSQYWPTYMFNYTEGSYSCGSAEPGRVDVRNNVFVLQAASGTSANTLQFGYCGNENFDFGVNWISPGWSTWRSAGPGTSTGASNMIAPAGNNPGFVSAAGNDFHLAAGSSALGIGGPLAPASTNNVLGLDLTPSLQYGGNQNTVPRAQSGSGSDLGAFER
jgi:hypothetical protein